LEENVLERTMTAKRMTDAELAEEARKWDSRERSPRDWVDAPEAVVRASEVETVSLRLPRQMLGLLREFARRQGIDYQVLIKKWLDERIAAEHLRMSSTV
jgi:predicted DNA binding CopG/RHH family protein